MESVNFELVTTAEGRRQLAYQVISTLAKDTTQPVSKPENWKAAEMLLNLEFVMTHKDRLYQEFADLCRDIRKNSTDETVRCLFLLGQINGLCRLPYGQRPNKTIRDMFDASDRLIQTFASCPRGRYLLSLWWFYAGANNRIIGEYFQSAKAYKESAHFAEFNGDTKIVAIARFCAAAEDVNNALVKDVNSVMPALANLRSAETLVKQVLTEKALGQSDVLWLHLIIPMNMIIFHFWGGVNDKSYDSLSDVTQCLELSTLDYQLFLSYQPTINTVAAVHALNHGVLALNKGDRAQSQKDFVFASLLAESVIENRLGPSPLPEYVATAHLVLAQVSEKSRVNPVPHLVNAARIVGSAQQVQAIARKALTRIASIP